MRCALVALVALAGCPTGAAPAVGPGRVARYLALGDSFTIGTGASPDRAFPARLVARWSERGCPVALENVAVDGYTSRDVVEEELPAIARVKPSFVTVAVGANDIVQGRSIDEYRADVKRILGAARDAGARVVVLPQPDWSRSPVAASFGEPAALAEAIARFNAALADEARASGATFVDLHSLMRRQADARMVAPDGLHPSAEAYDAWAAELARVTAAPCSR